MLFSIAQTIVFAAAVFVEAEDFSEKGRWEVDTQFVHRMGSAYLMAPGVGQPIGSARTTVEAPQAGRYFAWVRTKDWAPEKGPGTGPGRFALAVNDVRSDPLGVSGRTGWQWERAGSYDLKAGTNALELVDLSGWFARCDAVFLSTDPDAAPSRPKHETAAGGTYDVIVVGGGPAGMAASVAAARGGARTLLVQDRGLLGGNASHEFIIPMRGTADNHKVRETGLVEEAILWKSHLNRFGRGMSDAYAAQAAGETNLTVRLNARVVGAATQDGRIVSVEAQDTLTNARSAFRGRMFVDATGDGWLGYYAGAKYRQGREGPGESDDDWHPAKADGNMMKGDLGGWADKNDGYGFVRGYKAEDAGCPIRFETPAWAVAPKRFKFYPRCLARGWSAHPDSMDSLFDPEGTRDYMIRDIVGRWGLIKNGESAGEARNFRLAYIAWKVSKREGRRLAGDYWLTSKDMLAARVFPDRVAVGGYPISNHSAAPRLVPPIYTIPFRSLYSTNVVNLLMAGRCASVTHRAHGGLRVQGCAAVMGQAVGTAAAGCVRRGLTPREYGCKHIGELQQALLKDDQWIPGLRNEDPDDFARTAKRTDAADAVTLAWQKPVPAREVRVTFEYDRSEVDPRKPPAGLATAYEVEVQGGDGAWRRVGGETDNFRRLRVVRFPEEKIRGVRVTVRAWRGDPGSVGEVRVY